MLTTIYFTKRFTSGLLTGISVNARVSFDQARLATMAKRYTRGSKGRDCLTGDKWIVTDASFQNYVRPSVRNGLIA